MRRHEQFLEKLKKQRDMLDDLILTVSHTEKLDTLSRTYDTTTRTIEKNLLALRKSFLKTKNHN